MQLKACLQERIKNLQYLGTNFKVNMRSVYIGKATDATSSCFLNQCMKKQHYVDKFITMTRGSDINNLSQSAMLSVRIYCLCHHVRERRKSASVLIPNSPFSTAKR